MHKIFGRRAGLRVSELALGAGNFGTRWGHGAERFSVCARGSGTLGALNVKLPPKQMERLDETSVIPMGTPHEQINGSAATIAGGKPEFLQVAVIPVAQEEQKALRLSKGERWF